MHHVNSVGEAAWHGKYGEAGSVHISSPQDGGLGSLRLVTRPWPSVTVIVPTRPGQNSILAVDAAARLDYPTERLEILVVRGRQPACQRNAALRQARGEFIYFLDDDAVARPENLQRALPHFDRPEVQMVGGPNVCPADAPWLERVFAVVLGSWLAFGPSRARYEPVGTLRDTSEKELILCNLLARRDAVLEAGGFDEALYPNEENALMDNLQKNGGRLVYDPDLVVERRPRPTLKAFARMLRTYGRGRAEQFRRTPTLGSLPNFAPPAFVLYLACLAAFSVWQPRWSGLAALPLVLYVVALACQWLASSARHGPVRSAAALPLVVLTHLLYGVGFWRGLFTRLSSEASGRAADVALETFKSLPDAE